MDSPPQAPPVGPTPDYGSLGPASDLASGKALSPKSGGRAWFAILAGILLALPFVALGTVRAAWQQVEGLLTLHGKPEPASPAILSQHELEKLDHQSSQKQAETLLERALNHYDGANDQVAERVDRWHGQLKLTPRLNALLTAALDSNDLRVRAAAIEVDLAAYNIAKTSTSVDQLTQQAQSNDRATKVWALWALGLVANRGVEPERVTQTLVAHLKDPEDWSRQWAVEGLAHVGSNETIAPLLQEFHDDPSPLVRERAACSLAQSGMLKDEQRRTALPQILTYTDDPVLDAQTHTWAFQALRDITGQNLSDDAAAWRNWYSSSTN